MNTINPVIS